MASENPEHYFKVNGPYDIPLQKGKNVNDERLDEFWKPVDDGEAGSISERIGCYVFGVRTGGGIRPFYIGKTSRALKVEVFTERNMRAISVELNQQEKGSPVVFFLVEDGRNRSAKRVGELEEFLIQQAVSHGIEINNMKMTQLPDWGIYGAHRSRKLPTSDPIEFKKMLRLGEFDE